MTTVVSAGTVPFVGRQREMELVGAAVDGLLGGRGSVVVVSGDPGMGKTRFVQEALERARASGASTLTAAAQELDQLRPFGVVTDCLRVRAGASDAARRVAELLAGDVGPADASPMTLAFSPWRRPDGGAGVVAEASHLQMRLLERIGELVEHLSARSPLVIAVDDVQWADLGSLLALHRMAQQGRDLPVLLLCSHRPQPAGTDLGRFLDALPQEWTRSVPLARLSDAEVDDLVAALVDARVAGALAAAVRRAGGNPFFVLELMSALVGSGATDLASSDGDTDPQELPRSVTEAVARRLRPLPRTVYELLGVASVLGASFTASQLAIVMERPLSDLAGLLADALASGVLTEERGRFAFQHDLVREAVYASLPDALRAGLHLQTARNLSSVDGRADLVAEHLMRGATPGDPGAVALLHAAARQAGPRAPAISRKLLRRAIELADPADPSLDRLRADEVAILNWAGQASDVERISRDLLGRMHDPSVEPLVRLCLAQSLLGRGRLTEALEELDAATRSEALTAHERARFRAWSSKCLMLLGRMADAATVARLAVDEAEASGDVFARCLAGAVLALMTNFAGDYRPAVRLADEAIAIAAGDASADAHRFPLHLYQAALLLDVDEFDAAGEAVARGRQISEQLGTAWNLPMYHLISSVRLFWAGDWDDAVAEFEAGRDLADEIGGRIGMVAAFGLRSLIALHRGDVPTAEAMVAEGARELAATGPQYRADWFLWARAMLLEYRGDQRAAYELITEAWAGCEATGVVAKFPILGPDLVRLALANGDRTTAVTVCGRVEATIPADVPSLRAAALKCRALVSGMPEDVRAMASAYEQSPRVLDRALAWELAGDRLTTAMPEDGRHLLEQALAVYEALGASTDVARVDARLRSLGVHRGRRGPRKRPSTGWDALTPTEVTVARLVAEGLSNAEIADRLFISPRTARTHVSHALIKLGFRSRSELAAETVRRSSFLPVEPIVAASTIGGRAR